MTTNEIREKIHALRDENYKAFNSRLLPTVPPETMVGVRTPALKQLAKEISLSGGCGDFLSALPHALFEENQLHAFIISRSKSFEECIALTEKFLPYIDNWATCDQLCANVHKKHTEELMPYVKRWIKSGHTYTARYALRCLMMYYLDDKFDPAQLALAASVKSGDYYIDMAQGWYFATALAKHWEDALPWIEQRRLSPAVHKIAIRKSLESFRVSEEHKSVLREMA